MARRARLLFALTTALAAHSTTARANGRFPRAERLIEQPADPNQLLLAGTYGVLSTHDRGRSWYYVCEASFSLQDFYRGDPLLDLGANGSWLVGVQTSLNASYDEGCQWTSLVGGGSTYVFDDAISKSNPSIVAALLGTYEGGGIVYTLRRSSDGGKTWDAPTAAIPADTVYTIDLDPHDPAHVYASALANNVGQLLVSVDSGATWTAHDIPKASSQEAPYLAGLDPRDPNRVYVRTDSWVLTDGALTANDALLYSDDAGVTWNELIRSHAKLFGFALSPDGSTVLVGFGDPQGGAGEVVTGPFGVFASSTSTFSFEPIYDGKVGCLAWTKTGVYVCGSQAFDGFELGFAPDADFGADGGRLATLLSLGDVKGPLACGPNTTGAVCAATWDVACATFGACRDAGVADAGPEDARDASVRADADVSPEIDAGSACSCRSGSHDRRPDGALGAWLVAVAAARRVSRRARDRKPTRCSPPHDESSPRRRA
jgi:hypothetical protein